MLSSVVRTLGESATNIEPWVIARPLVVSFLFALLAPAVTRFVLGPLFRRVLEPHLFHPTLGQSLSLFLLVSIASASVSIIYVIGGSMLLGAYVAGLIVSALPSSAASLTPTPPLTLASSSHLTHTSPVSLAPFRSALPHSRSQAPPLSPLPPTAGDSTHVHPFHQVYDLYIAPVQKYILSPLFFASIGTSIPFLSLFTGKLIWQGVVYTILMTIAKALCGLIIVLWGIGERLTEAHVEWKENVLKDEQGIEMHAACGEDDPPSAPVTLLQSTLPSTQSCERRSREGIDARTDTETPLGTSTVEAAPGPNDAAKNGEGPSGKDRQLINGGWRSDVAPAAFLGLALVARGEIGLLISQIAYTEAGLLSSDAFLVTTWAIVLCTVIGPVRYVPSCPGTRWISVSGTRSGFIANLSVHEKYHPLSSNVASGSVGLLIKRLGEDRVVPRRWR